ncbi:MAG: ATP-binding cassette domain-containing protein, partial [Acidimicrobiales bacterium]
MLEIRGLTAGYGDVPVLHGIDLRVASGEVVALLGPNGAGKTTTMLALAGVL